MGTEFSGGCLTTDERLKALRPEDWPGISPYSSKAIRSLMDAGIIPKNCSKWTLVSDPRDCVRMISEVVVTEREFQTIADALLNNRDEARQMAQVLVRSKDRTDDTEGIGPL